MLQLFIGEMLPCLKEEETKIKAVPPELLPALISLSLENIQEQRGLLSGLLSVQTQWSLVRGQCRELYPPTFLHWGEMFS